MNKEELVIAVQPCGLDISPRFRVLRSDGKYWNAEKKEWLDEFECTLYLSNQEAAEVACHLIESFYDHLPHQIFQCPITLIVSSEKPIPQREIEEWMYKVTEVVVNATELNGNGPRPGSFVKIRIDWKDMRKVKG